MSSNNIVVYPARFDGYDNDTNQRLFTVEIFDECTATVKIDTLVDVESWEEIAKEVAKCIAQMVNSSGID